MATEYSVKGRNCRFNVCPILNRGQLLKKQFSFLSAHSFLSQYSRLSVSRLRLSRITAYLEEKVWSFFKRRNLTSRYKILCIVGEIAPKEQFLPFSTIFSIHICN